jgi:hypothetical protein
MYIFSDKTLSATEPPKNKKKRKPTKKRKSTKGKPGTGHG